MAYLRTLPLLAFALSLFLAPGCAPADEDPQDAGSDAGSDAGQNDAGETDAGSQDAGGQDAGESDAGSQDAGEPDAGEPDAGEPDAGETDAGEPDAGEADAGEADAGETDAGETGEDAGTSSNLGCTFNADCPDHERCECDIETGCICRIGVRGTGVNGVDTCEDGNDCASSLCVEGQNATYYCSDECDTSDDCGEHLPVCSNVAFVGRICIRQPPG